MTTLEGQVAIVTGAAQGIGAAYARRLATLGATTIVADIDEAGAETTAKQLVADGYAAKAMAVDIADKESTEALVASVIADSGKIDILVNNAAIYRGMQLEVAEDIDLAYWRRMIDVNITGTYLMSRALIPAFRAQGSGIIVNQSSIAAMLAPAMSLHYAVTKAAIITMTKVLANELGEDGIRVNAIAPGVIGTEATMEAIPEMMQEMFVMNSALKRIGQPEDLLGALEFLCSPLSAYMTGQTLVVDGGVFMLG